MKSITWKHINGIISIFENQNLKINFYFNHEKNTTLLIIIQQIKTMKIEITKKLNI